MNTSYRNSRLSVQTDEVKQKYVECPACNKEYDDFLHAPHILPCLHALCITCLESLASRGIVQCATCETKHTIPGGDIQQFRLDETRQYLANVLKVQRRTNDIVCQECKIQTKFAKVRCKECAQFLCPDCADAHKRTKITKKHALTSLEDLREAPMDDFQRTKMCVVPGHEEQPYTFYCVSETCDRPVCALCAITEHQESKGHEIREIQDVYGEQKRAIEGLMSDVKHRTLSAKDTASAIQDTIFNLDSNVQGISTQIDTAFDNCIKVLDRRRAELKDLAHAKSKEKKKRLVAQLDSINFHIDCMEDSNEFTGSVANYASPAELLFFKDIIIDRLNSLRDEEFDTIPHDNEEIKFQPTKLGDEFLRHAKDMGEMWTTSAYLPNTHVETRDVTLEREQTMMKITLFDSEGMQQIDGGVDLRVDVIDPSGRRRAATIHERTDAEGRYKALFTATTKGKHRATLYLYGTPLDNDHVFRASSPRGADRSNANKYNLSRVEQTQQKTVGDKDEQFRRLQTATPSDTSDDLSPITDNVLGDVTCPGFVLDATTSHNSVEIREEGKSMTVKPNKLNKGNTTRRSTREKGRFALFRGAMASRPFQKSGRYYFEVGVLYKIHRLIKKEQLFEIGLSKLESIDRNASVDCHPYAWVVSARGCHICGKVCLQAWHNSQLLSHYALSPRTKTHAGTMIRLYYGFILDTESKHWTVIDVKNKAVVFKFTNLVVSERSEPLWPVFSVSGAEAATTTMTLKTGRVIDSVPEEALNVLEP